jgi:hypothetical protein
MPTVIARVDAPMKAALKALATQRKCTESALLVSAVSALTGTKPAEPDPRRIVNQSAPPYLSAAMPLVRRPRKHYPLIVNRVKIARDPASLATEKLNVRVPKFLYLAARVQSASKRMRGMGGWVSALIQSNLLKSPVMTPAQLVEIQRSNRELAAIGRNINQIARSLNLAPSEFERVRLEVLADLSQKLDFNRMAIRRLVQDANRSWGVSDDVNNEG